MKYFLISFFLFIQQYTFAQNTILTGAVKSETNQAIEHVSITIQGYKIQTETAENGQYSVTLPNVRTIKITYSKIGFKTKELEIGLLINEVNKQDIVLSPESHTLEEIAVKAKRFNNLNTIAVDPKNFQSLPSVSGSFESALKLLPGVAVNNELSSQYSVRGGNFDENLVYVNDIEIFRPQLLKNGQQEGLSFINSDLASTVSFSAGGFESKYGDRLSSVLDVRYFKPDSISIKAEVGLTGFSTAFKLPYKRSFLLVGIRKKDNSNILRSQPIKGSYQPQFSDYQLLYQKEISKTISFSVLGNYNAGYFSLEPETRNTRFGTSTENFMLNVNYDGKEVDRYRMLVGGLTMTYKPSANLNIKWITSATHINEKQNIDIIGSYVFDKFDNSDSLPDSVGKGIGSQTNFASNNFNASIYNTDLRFYKQYFKSFFEAGVKYQRSEIFDAINEYTRIDSAGVRLPYTAESGFFPDILNVKNTQNVNQFSAFLQNTFRLSSNTVFTAGLRTVYNSFTNEFLWSPRFAIGYQLKQIDDFHIRLSGGVYNQPPFYREFRNYNGTLNTNAKAQKSVHLLAGADYGFYGLGTQLKFTSEFYYKFLNRLTPYKIENLQIRYFADQQSKGYATGVDFSLNGEFVKDLASTFRLSFMKTAEDIKNDYRVSKSPSSVDIAEVGYLKRPTDQRLNFSVFFQDRLPQNPSYKVHLSMLYGSALPIGPPSAPRYKDIYEIPSYKRVDIGFSKDLVDADNHRPNIFLKRYFKSLIAQAEIFNLLNINNTVSYLWIKDVTNNQFAVPNYLSSRQLNIKIIARFY